MKSRPEQKNTHAFFRKLIMLFGVTMILQGCSVVGVRTTEEASYTILTQDNEIELRRYAAVMGVDTYVAEADFREASNLAFRRLFEYITGNNVATNDIAMTAPVMASPSTETTSQNIAMTSPVIATPQTTTQAGWTLTFVLPADFTAASAPAPTNPAVQLRELPEKTVAAIRYTGLWNKEQFDTQTQMLNNWITEKGYQAVSGPSYAGYDPPWALPFLRRNEVLIDVQP